MSELQKKHKQLKRLRIRNITLNTVCILLALAGISWTINYFWKYVHYEITNDAVVDQYIAPLNIRASGYIKEVHFTEHQPVHAGDTLLILDNREYLIKVKDAEAALMDAKGAKDVLSSGIQTSQVNVAIQEANIAETKAKLWQQEQDYRRYANLLAEESVSQQQYEQVKTAYEATKARYQALLQQKEAAKSQYSLNENPSARIPSGGVSRIIHENSLFKHASNSPIRGLAINCVGFGGTVPPNITCKLSFTFSTSIPGASTIPAR